LQDYLSLRAIECFDRAVKFMESEIFSLSGGGGWGELIPA
jgi:hypothetical protein